MTTSTSLSLRALLKSAVARAGLDRAAQLLSGVTPSAKALYVAAAAQAIPHGVVCGTLVAAATEANIKALSARAPDNEALEKYAQVGRHLAAKPLLSREVAWEEFSADTQRLDTEDGFATVRRLWNPGIGYPEDCGQLQWQQHEDQPGGTD